jgi:hypothetical protein
LHSVAVLISDLLKALSGIGQGVGSVVHEIGLLLERCGLCSQSCGLLKEIVSVAKGSLRCQREWLFRHENPKYWFHGCQMDDQKIGVE